MTRIALAAAAAAALATGGCASSTSTQRSDRVASLPSGSTATAAATATSTTATRAPAPKLLPRRARRSSSHARVAHVPPAHPVPASFRVAAGAPSDAEVRRELAQMYAIEHHQQQLAALSAAAANFATLLPWNLERKTNQVSVASVFTDYGLGLACGGLLGRDQIGVAHKTAPCGTLIDFRYGGRELVVPVIDRGPYIAGREWDLTGATAKALGFPGLGQIQWSVVGG